MFLFALRFFLEFKHVRKSDLVVFLRFGSFASYQKELFLGNDNYVVFQDVLFFIFEFCFGNSDCQKTLEMKDFSLLSVFWRTTK